MKKQQPDLNRRSLLKAITVGSAATAAIAVSGASVAKATESNISIKGSNGYKETAHIRSYYDSLRG